MKNTHERKKVTKRIACEHRVKQNASDNTANYIEMDVTPPITNLCTVHASKAGQSKDQALV